MNLLCKQMQRSTTQPLVKLLRQKKFRAFSASLADCRDNTYIYIFYYSPFMYFLIFRKACLNNPCGLRLSSILAGPENVTAVCSPLIMNSVTHARARAGGPLLLFSVTAESRVATATVDISCSAAVAAIICLWCEREALKEREGCGGRGGEQTWWCSRHYHKNIVSSCRCWTRVRLYGSLMHCT